MKPLLAITAAAALLLAGCSQNGETTAAGTNDYGSGNPLSAPADYVGAVGQAQKHAVRQVDLASLKKAIQMFEVSEDRLPTNLNEVVAKRYLPEMPEPPPGSRIIYNARTGDVQIRRE